MTVAVKHNFIASHGEDPDPSLVAQNAWNDAHAVTVDPGLVGRSPEGGAGPAQTIAVGSGLVLAGGVLGAIGGGGATGPTGPPGPTGPTGVINISTAGGIAGGPISSTGTIVLADVPAASIKGRTAGSVGPPADLTGAQATALLDPFTSSAKGLVPASGGGTTNFLRADGAFVPPPGGSGGGGSLTNIDTGVGLTGGPITISGTVSMANVPSMTVKGRVAAGAGAPTDLFSPDITSLISPFTSSTKGAVPASGGGTTNFLRADGAFAAPPGSGGGALVVGSTPISGGSSGKILYDNAGVLGETTATGGSGGSSPETLLSFSNVGEAQSAVIPITTTALQTQGFNAKGDGGGGNYNRVSSPITPYVDAPIPPIPPGFASGVPNLIFASTVSNNSVNWVSTQPIIAGSLTILIVFDYTDHAGAILSAPASFTDSAGNIYLLAVSAAGGQYGWSHAIYYCANPIYSPIGTNFDSIRLDASGHNAPLNIAVYCMAGFTGAVLDRTASALGATPPTTSATVTATGLDTSLQQIAVGAVQAGGNSLLSTNGPAHTPPAGWASISPPASTINPMDAIMTKGAASATYNPTFTSVGQPTVALIATFKSVSVVRTALDPSYWQLAPAWPLHIAQYGIMPVPIDNAVAYRNFGRWIASIAPPSDTSDNAKIIPGGASAIVAAGTSYDNGGFLTLALKDPIIGLTTTGTTTVWVLVDQLTGTGNFAQLNGTWQVGIANPPPTNSIALFVTSGLSTPTPTTVTGGNVIYSGCTISNGSPAVVTVNTPRFVQ